MIPELTGVILAGGKSSRFGSNKALADWNGTAMVSAVVDSLLRIVPRALVVVKEMEALAFLRRDRVEVIPDLYREGHPLGGLGTALEKMETGHAFVCACDMPLMSIGLIEGMWAARADYDAVVPVWGGLRQPLCGIYSKACSGVIRASIGEGALEISRLFDVLKTRFFLEEEIRALDRDGLSFMDIDTREDFERARGAAKG